MNKFVSHLKCTLCKKTYLPHEVSTTCPTCGDQGILDVIYDYETLKKFIHRDSFKMENRNTMFRYRHLLPIEGTHIDEMLSIGWTPLYHTKKLHNILNIKALYLKDDGQNPSASLKDRASAIAVLRAIEEKQSIVSCSSTGNAASSLAASAARMGLTSYIFVPKRAPIGKLTQLLMYGANVISVDGDYKDTYHLSKMAIDHYGWYNRNAAINPYLVEGKKTVAYEIAEQLNYKPTDWVVVSVGDGCTIAGVYKGFYDFKKLGLIKEIPHLLGVQSLECNPLVEAFQNHQEVKEKAENSLADSISVGIPRNPIKALKAVEKSKGHMISVSDESILEAMKTLGSHEGVFAEPAAAASLAGLIEAVNQKIILEHQSVTLIITGNGLKDPKNATLATNEPVCLKPNLDMLINYIQNKGDKDNV